MATTALDREKLGNEIHELFKRFGATMPDGLEESLNRLFTVPNVLDREKLWHEIRLDLEKEHGLIPKSFLPQFTARLNAIEQKYLGETTVFQENTTTPETPNQKPEQKKEVQHAPQHTPTPTSTQNAKPTEQTSATEETILIEEQQPQSESQTVIVTSSPSGISQGFGGASIAEESSDTSADTSQDTTSQSQSTQSSGTGGSNPISRIRNFKKNFGKIKNARNMLSGAKNALTAARAGAASAEAIEAIAAGESNPVGWIITAIVIGIILIILLLIYIAIIISALGGPTAQTGDTTSIASAAKNISDRLCRTFPLGSPIPHASQYSNGVDCYNNIASLFDRLEPNPLVFVGNSYKIQMRNADFLHPQGRYYCTDLVIDSYNAVLDPQMYGANPTGKGIPEGTGCIGSPGGMIDFFRTKPGYAYLPFSNLSTTCAGTLCQACIETQGSRCSSIVDQAQLQIIQPGFAIFFTGDHPQCGGQVKSITNQAFIHTGIIKSITLEKNGQGQYSGNGSLDTYESNNWNVMNTYPISNWHFNTTSVGGFGGLTAPTSTTPTPIPSGQTP